MDNYKQKLVIARRYKEFQTESDVTLYQGYEVLFECKSLELPWKDNKRRESCIPEGVYKAQRHISPNFGKSIWIRDVPDRSEILMHVGNFIASAMPDPESDGCPLVGEQFMDISGYGYNDLTKSAITIQRIYDECDDELTVEIREAE